MRILCMAALVILPALSVFSQSDTLNKFNTKGKKHGYWKCFLDEKLNKTDSINAFFYAFELYDNGEEVWVYRKEKNHTKTFVSLSKAKPAKGIPQVVDGNFKFYERGHLIEEIYSNGFPVRYFTYSESDGNDAEMYISKVCDFTRLYNNIPGTYLEKTANENAYENLYWFRKGSNGWRLYPLMSDSITQKAYSEFCMLNANFYLSDMKPGEFGELTYIVKVYNPELKEIYNKKHSNEDNCRIDSLKKGTYKICVYIHEASSEPLMTKIVELKPGHISRINIDINIERNQYEFTEGYGVTRQLKEAQISLFYMQSKWLNLPSQITDYGGLSLSGFAGHSFNKHLGIYIGGGVGLSHYYLAKDTTFVSHPLPQEKIFERYVNTHAHVETKLKLATGNLNKTYAGSGGFVIDVGAGYYLPVIFHHVTRYSDNIKLKNKFIHQYTDFRAFVNIGFSPVNLFFEYRLSYFLMGHYPEVPVYTIGIRLTGITHNTIAVD